MLRIAALTARFFPVIAVLCVVPLIVGVVAGDWQLALPLLPFAGLSIFIAWRSFRTAAPRDVTEAEDAVAVALAFPLGLLFSSAPYLTHGLGPLDTVFEGMSAITGTGLSRYTDIEAQGFALHFLRAWTQFIGGYAIVTLTVALLPRAARAAQRMAKSDVADDGGKDGEGGVDLRERAAQVTGVYVALTALCILLTRAAGTDWSFALLHGLTAVSTAGMSSLNDSLTEVPHLATAILMGFAILGAIALSDYVRPAIERAGLFKLALVLGVLIALTLIFGVSIHALEAAAGQPVAWFDAFQIASSAQTTTGFSSLSVPDLTDGSKGVLILSMYIGADLGSTGGGIKLARFFVLALALWCLLRRTEPDQEPPGGGPKAALRLIAIWLAASLVGWPLLMLDGAPPLDALFEFASSLNNVGLSAGPSAAETVPPLTQIVLILAMWLGRVEILAALLLLKPATWRR